MMQITYYGGGGGKWDPHKRSQFENTFYNIQHSMTFKYQS